MAAASFWSCGHADMGRDDDAMALLKPGNAGAAVVSCCWKPPKAVDWSEAAAAETAVPKSGC
jgi:hypothetical protein